MCLCKLNTTYIYEIKKKVINVDARNMKNMKNMKNMRERKSNEVKR